MELRNTTTDEIVEVIIIDPRTGLDISDDLIGNTMHNFSWNDEHECWETDLEDLKWWQEFAVEYQEADEAVFQFFHDIKEYVDECEEEKIKDWYNDYIGGVEFNDLPNTMMVFVEEKKKELGMY